MSKTETAEQQTKEQMYKTARARISCAEFKAGEFVSIEYHGKGTSGEHWFRVTGSESRGKFGMTYYGRATDFSVCYPMKHLTDFCL